MFSLINYRIRLLLLVLILPVAGWQAAPVSAQQGSTGSFLPGEVVLKLSGTTVLPDVAAQFGLDPVPLSQFGSRAIYRLRIIDGDLVELKVAALQADPSGRIIYAEPDYLYKAPEDTRVSWGVGDSFSTGGDFAAYRSQWVVQEIGLHDAQKISRGAGITIAVLDTGVDMTHPALAGHLIQGFDFVDNDTDPSEVGNQQTGPFGHGTHVAGLIALVAPDAHIMPLRVMDQNGLSNVWVLAEALAYAVDPNNNQVTHRGADVINMSLGTLRQTHLLSSILDRVCNGPSLTGDDDLPGIGNPGVVVVAAAGNGGDGTKVYPAAEQINGLLAVASSDSNDALSTFSTRGSWIQVAAPGEQVMSTVPGGNYGTWSGTSMASPIAAGEVALIRATFTTLQNTKVIRQVIDTAVRIQSPISSRISVSGSVTTAPEADPSPTPTPTPTPTPPPSPTPTPVPVLVNQIDDPQFFVTQHYSDFLDRTPDAAGAAFWAGKISACGSDAACIHAERVGVSAAFFIEQEFQDTGSFIQRMYKASLGIDPTFVQFQQDHANVIGGANLQASKQAFGDQFVARAAFQTQYATSLSTDAFVNKLFDTAALKPYTTERQAAITAMNTGATRSSVLMNLIEDPGFKQREFNGEFVLAQYFGYLRRDADQGGYNFWLNILNNKLPNDTSGYHAMVCAFITSAEYQLRFGTVVTHSNSECGS